MRILMNGYFLENDSIMGLKVPPSNEEITRSVPSCLALATISSRLVRKRKPLLSAALLASRTAEFTEAASTPEQQPAIRQTATNKRIPITCLPPAYINVPTK